jgi:thiol:disulfide interchange protein
MTKFKLFPALALLSLGAQAAPVQTPHVEAELIAENTALQAGDNWVALRLAPEAGWHVYWQNPGDSGLATQLDWTLPAGISAGSIHWPYPHTEKLGELTNYGYADETLHLVPLTVDGAFRAPEAELRAEARWLVCKDVCIPGKAELSLRLPVRDTAQQDERWAAAFTRAHAQLPRVVDWPARFSAGDGDFSLAVDAAELEGAEHIELFPLAGDLVAHSAPQRIERDGRTLRLSQALSPYFLQAPETVDAVLVIASETTRAYQIRALPGVAAPVTLAPANVPADTPVAAATDPGLLLVLGFALLGGLILNLMPCVFPVLSLKALAVMQGGQDPDHDHRAHALSYTAGVVLSCVAVAGVLLLLRAGGQALGWGFQLQSPVFIAALAYVMFALGLSLSGVMELGSGLMGLGQSLTQKKGLSGSFFTGVLATVVASPCTAPFMGTALGYAVTQPAPLALLVFATLGLGLALPFLVLGFVPALARLLPRPGAWMETFKQFMAFPLYLTAVWLLWVLSHQSSADAVALAGIGLVLIAFALWLWRHGGALAATLRYAALAAALALLAHPLMRTAEPPAATDEHATWSAARVAELRAAGRTVFVNFTADWCITCKANERIALNSTRVQEAMRQRNVAWLTADWTREDPAITAELARFGRNGVPLYLVYVQGGEPTVLPQLLTPDLIIEALQ